jgi:hypothetical protein
MKDFKAFLNLKRAVEETRATYAKVAQSVYDSFEDGSSGMCHDIAEAVASEMSGKFQNIDISEYFGKSVGSRDHVSISLVDHSSQKAFELNIPEEKYQRRIGSLFFKIPAAVFGPSDIMVSEINYLDFV